MNAVVANDQGTANTPMNPMEVLLLAIQQNTDMAKIEKLMELEERWRAAQAKRAYIRAFAAFKKNMPEVVKDMLNTQYNSDYSSLANLVNTTNKVLGEYGLNASWRPDQSSGITITCILSHEDGHSEQVSLTGPPDNTGQKNQLQQIKSTLTYLEGATFQAITGVVARSVSRDDDGNSSDRKRQPITSEQVTIVRDLIKETGANEARFLAFLKVPSIEEIPSQGFEHAVRELRRKLPRLTAEQIANIEALRSEIGYDRQTLLRELRAKSLEQIYAKEYGDVIKFLEQKRSAQ